MLAEEKTEELGEYFIHERPGFSSMIEIEFNNLPKGCRVKKGPYNLNVLNFIKIISLNKSNVVFDQGEKTYYKWFLIQDVKNDIHEII